MGIELGKALGMGLGRELGMRLEMGIRMGLPYTQYDHHLIPQGLHKNEALKVVG